MAVEVRAPSRLHLGMLSFGVAGARSYGGVGVMIDRPAVHVRLRRGSRIEARGPHAERVAGFARSCAVAWRLGDVGCEIEVVTAPPAHVGLGSGTQLGLAVAAGMRHLFTMGDEAHVPAATPHPVQDELVGRGRRSCVGVYGFSRGGLIVEAGRSISAPEAHDDAKRQFSPMVARVRLPSTWRCVVIVGRDVAGLHGEAEKAAFSRLPPVPNAVSAELARIALLELLPAAVEAKFLEFAQAVKRYGTVAGKPFETESRDLPYAGATARLLELLDELGFPGAAQSSWGPAVMVCCETLELAGQLVEVLESLGLAEHHDLLIARFDAQGATLREVS